MSEGAPLQNLSVSRVLEGAPLQKPSLDTAMTVTLVKKQIPRFAGDDNSDNASSIAVEEEMVTKN